MNKERWQNVLQTPLASLDYNSTFRRLQPLEVHCVDSVMIGEPCMGDYMVGGDRGVVEYYPEIWWEGMRKTTKFLDRATRVPADNRTTSIQNTSLLTPWSRVLLEKLTGSAASQEIPCIFGTRRFITVLTSARHLSLS